MPERPQHLLALDQGTSSSRAIVFDVSGQILVALDRYRLVKGTRRPDVGEPVRSAEGRVLVRAQQPAQHGCLRCLRVVGQRLEGPPLAEPQPRHRRLRHETHLVRNLLAF